MVGGPQPNSVSKSRWLRGPVPPPGVGGVPQAVGGPSSVLPMGREGQLLAAVTGLWPLRTAVLPLQGFHVHLGEGAESCVDSKCLLSS